MYIYILRRDKKKKKKKSGLNINRECVRVEVGCLLDMNWAAEIPMTSE